MGILNPYPDSYHVKNYNKRVILDMIRFTPGGTSRAELARQVGLTRSAITTIVNDILNEDLVREAENGPATGGRRAIILEMNPSRGYVVGIDMGATHMGLLVSDFAARVIQEIEIPFTIEQGPQSGLQILDTQYRELLSRANLKPDDILAVGIGVPGPVNASAGVVSVPPIMPGWDNYPVHSYLEDIWHCPVSLNNDAELGALGEWAYGAGRREQHLAYIKVGTGIGAGLLLDGKIYRGATGSAGEIGHITIADHGPRCTCGKNGCLEALASGRAIARRAIEAAHSGRRTHLSSIDPLDGITTRDVATAARLGDLISQQIISEAGRYLGIAIASLVNLFNPNVVVVGGGVAQMGDLLLEPIRQAIHDRSLWSAAQAVRVTSAILGRRSSSMGAVVQALNVALHQITEYP